MSHSGGSSADLFTLVTMLNGNLNSGLNTVFVIRKLKENSLLLLLFDVFSPVRPMM